MSRINSLLIKTVECFQSNKLVATFPGNVELFYNEPDSRGFERVCTISGAINILPDFKPDEEMLIITTFNTGEKAEGKFYISRFQNPIEQGDIIILGLAGALEYHKADE